jgi:AcrR family transcriptional regulator
VARPRSASGQGADGTSDPAGRDPLPAILEAAGQLLDEAGVEGLNTTAVARRAGVSTATLYRHFPDKHAVLRAVVLAVHEERARAVVGFYERFVTEPDWRAPLTELIRETYRLRISRPGGRSTRRALQVSPELWEWDRRQNEELARGFARAMRRRRPELTRARTERVALALVTATVALLDLACLDERRAEAVIAEAIAIRTAYLAPLLD